MDAFSRAIVAHSDLMCELFVVAFVGIFIITALLDGMARGRLRRWLGPYLLRVHDALGLNNKWTHFQNSDVPPDRLRVVLELHDGRSRDFTLRPALATCTWLDKAASHRMRKFEAAVLADPQSILLLGLVQHIITELGDENTETVRSIAFQRIVTRLPALTSPEDCVVTKYEEITSYVIADLDWSS